MAPNVISKGGEKNRGEGKSNRPNAHWTTANKKFFLDLALEEKVKGNRPSKDFNAIRWENIIKSFNEKTCLGYEFLQFKNLYS